jgi:2-polyprenyl-3-methyl-5-hydroxy-6-metoxy-1,4-benzoquinol methylase
MSQDSPEQLAYYYERRPLNLMGKRIEFMDYHSRKHRCAVCGGTATQPLGEGWIYTEPDQYETQVGKETVRREWRRCHRCKMVQQIGSLSNSESIRLYTNGYRSIKMRNRSVRDEYDRIVSGGQSENLYRVEWILNQIDTCRSLLDVGSGLGVFPSEMKKRIPDLKVHCFEPNTDSSLFINDTLKIPCEQTTYTPWVFKGTFDLVSMIHILEHIHRPYEFMRNIAMDTGKWVYIEVPDSIEFEYLNQDHDEFNSTHHWFWSPRHIVEFLDRCDFTIHAMHTNVTERNLSRIMVLAKRKPRCWMIMGS